MRPSSAISAKTIFPPSLRAGLNVQGTTRVVTATGELDVASHGRVASLIDRALEDRPETLVLDLSALEFCDSSGVHMVVRSQRHCHRMRTELRVIPPTGPARRVFELCRIDECVTFVDI